MYSLLNRGIIPKDVDLTPAFERGQASLTATKAVISEGLPKPAQTQLVPTQYKLQESKLQGKDENTFLTAVGGDID